MALVGCAVIIALTAAAALCAPGVRNLTAPTGADLAEPLRLEPVGAPATPLVPVVGSGDLPG
jgi:hypothetical protein